MSTFESFAISPAILEKLAPKGIVEPTEIQKAAMPPLLEGKDVLIQSQTGTGKTLAYLLPLLGRLDPERKDLQAIIIAPTRELGMQIVNLLRELTEGGPFTVQPLIGGANIRHQIDRLKKNPTLVVGTPGRLAELIASGRLKTPPVRHVVIDEVDHVLDPVFRNDVVRILKAVPRERQTVFVSATIPEEVREIARRWMNEPVHVKVEGGLMLPETLTHQVIFVEERDRIDALRRLFHAYQPKAALAFVNDGRRIEELSSKLAYKGLTVAALQGSAGKLDRGTVLKEFREGKIQVLLATEVAARGLDISGLTHVFNLDLPTDADHYLHRAGRTGRQGQAGTVVSIATEKERFVVEKFAKALGITIDPIETSHGKVVSKRSGQRPE